MRILIILAFLGAFFAGCEDKKEVVLDKPPVENEAPSDVPVNTNEPVKIDLANPPAPVGE